MRQNERVVNAHSIPFFVIATPFAALLAGAEEPVQNQIVRRALTMLLLSVLLVQLGPACGFGNAPAMDSMQCCQSKCPARSSQMPANCCRMSASSDKAKPAIATALQPALVTIGHLALVALHKISDLSFVTYRSPAPPPPRMRLDLFCSRQI